MDRALGGDRRLRLVVIGTTSALATAIVMFAWQAFTASEGASYMTSDSGSTTSTDTATGTATESCTVIPMVPNAPEDIPLPTDAVLHPNAQAVISSNQEAIRHLKFALRGAHSCAEQQIIRDHIQALRLQIADMRSGVVPIRPPVNFD